MRFLTAFMPRKRQLQSTGGRSRIKQDRTYEVPSILSRLPGNKEIRLRITVQVPTVLKVKQPTLTERGIRLQGK